MSLNEKFGRGGGDVRKLNIPDTPDTHMLQKLLSDLSTATTLAKCDISWQSGENSFTLTLNHSRQAARAGWKLYKGKGLQSSLVWDYATNDVAFVHKLILDSLKQISASQSQIRIPAVQNPADILEERRAVNINSNLSGKLRKLFIGTQEDLIAENRPPISPIAKSKVSTKFKVEYIDLSPGRQLLEHLFVGQFGIFSYPTFLFFLEREYFEAIENKNHLALIVFKAIENNASSLNIAQALSPVILQEIAKRINQTQRKTDILAEYDQNTFAVLLPDTSTIGGKTFIRRVEKALFKSALDSEVAESSIKFAFGLATLGEHCNTLPSLLLFARKALEKAQKLGTDIVCDQDIIAEPDFKQHEYLGKPIDLTPTKQLVSELVSAGIFTYAAFLAFLEHEYYRSIRKKRDLLIMLLKIRTYEESFDEAINLLPPPAFYEVIRRVSLLLGKRDIFAHYGHGNFIIMRSNTSVVQMQNFAKRIEQSIMKEKWLTPECPISAVRIRSEVYTVKAQEDTPNMFGLFPAK